MCDATRFQQKQCGHPYKHETAKQWKYYNIIDFLGLAACDAIVQHLHHLLFYILFIYVAHHIRKTNLDIVLACKT